MSNDHRDYDSGELRDEDATVSPRELFEEWLNDAIRSGVRDPHAMVLSTVSATGVPSSRVVLAKFIDDKGLVFFTNYESHKARDIAAHPTVALLFHWASLDRVVRVEGTASKISEAESDQYFQSRPLGSQYGAIASPQSRIIASRDELVKRVRDVRERYEDSGEAVQRPDTWGGYRVIPSIVEFWQGRPDRLHDRLRYRRSQGTWVFERLAP